MLIISLLSTCRFRILLFTHCLILIVYFTFLSPQNAVYQCIVVKAISAANLCMLIINVSFYLQCALKVQLI